MKILCTGSNGQLGRHFRLLASESCHTWLFTDIDELDITSKEAVERFPLYLRRSFSAAAVGSGDAL